MSRGKEYKETANLLVMVTQLGLTMAGSILLGFAVGYYLDKWLGTRGLFLVVFIILGVLGGGWTVFRQINGIENWPGSKSDSRNRLEK